jgi:aryl-alcohol dehydrogenase-like predicted oxidoreductase/HEAT repeat protein
MRDAEVHEGAGLEALLDDDPERRLEAIAAAPPTAVSAYALRARLLLDARAEHRAQAATRLGGMREVAPQVARWLEDALADPLPSVRAAAYTALGRAGDERAIPSLHRGALEEPSWWVRREAVRALARVGGQAAAPTLRRVLEDPFWRVRNTAVRALSALGWRGELDDGKAPSEVASAALRYLHGGSGDPDAAAATSEGLANPDPAVTTARLERAGNVSASELVRFLADPHLPLRREAARRLLASDDPDALERCLALLDDPRRPHAPATVRALLAELDGALAAELARRALASGSEGAAEWALGWSAEHGDAELGRALVGALADPRPRVRRAAARSLGALAELPEGALAALEAALADDDGRTRSAVVEALAPRTADDPALAERLGTALEGELSTAARVALAALPGLDARLVDDEHPIVRASALEALAERGALSAEQRERALRDPDPWVRASALDAPAALAVLADEALEPQLRRTALEHLVRGWRGRALARPEALAAARLAARARDPWLRARTCALLDPRDAAERTLLLELTRDRDPIVRASASDPLERAEEIVPELRATLDELGEEVLSATLGLLVRDGSEESAEVLEQAIRDCPPERGALRERLRALTLVFPEEVLEARPGLAALVPPPPPRAAAPAPVPRTARARAGAVERRPLGSTGLLVSPLGLSGVHNLPVASLREAHEAGVNLFFWEPRHHTLTRFVREQRAARDELVLVAGSFHGSAAAVREDVELALRRLKTDHLDLFLLFWARSAERLGEELADELSVLRREGKLRAAGFSTHHRELARAALLSRRWDAAMIRHSAAHPGAEAELLPTVRELGVGVLGFSALCYGRLLRRVPGSTSEPPSAADCYRYSLSQPGISAVISAPRRQRELEENLEVLARPTLEPEVLARLREHGAQVHRESERFNQLVRQAGRAAGSPLTPVAHALEQDELEPGLAPCELEETHA